MFVTRHEHNASQVLAVITARLYITLRNTHLRPTLNLYPHWPLALGSQAWICFQLLKENSSFVRKIDLHQFSRIGGSAENMHSQVSQRGINQFRHITFSEPHLQNNQRCSSSSHSYSPGLTGT